MLPPPASVVTKVVAIMMRRMTLLTVSATYSALLATSTVMPRGPLKRASGPAPIWLPAALHATQPPPASVCTTPDAGLKKRTALLVMSVKYTSAPTMTAPMG